ncbi:unnamed protein product, partial [Prunus brigantina]
MEDDATQLVIQLEDNLGLGEVRNGIPLIGILMADKFPNQGAIKGILRKSWEQMGEVKISVAKDNLLAITVESEEMVGRILEGVELDARKPLVEGFWIPRQSRTELWAEIRYERLGDYCYHCGRLGHSTDLCRFPHGGFGIFTTDLRAKALRPSFRKGAGENTGWNYQSNLSTLVRGHRASEMERE